jgi:acetyl esterase/lipase
VCVPESAELYAPLQPKPPYAGVKFTRDVSFGPDAKNVLDVAEPETGGGSRSVLIYLSGGAGNKQQGGPDGEAFYDNIMVWAVKNGMVGVNMQRRSGEAWDDPAKDVSLVVQWVNKNIAQHQGNPNRVFAWSQSAGNIPLSAYVAHSEFWGTAGIGLKGVIFMSPPAFDILPVIPPPVQGAAFAPCGSPNGSSPAAAAAGRGGGPGGGRGLGGDVGHLRTPLHSWPVRICPG